MQMFRISVARQIMLLCSNYHVAKLVNPEGFATAD